jgi:hypothetical protein
MRQMVLCAVALVCALSGLARADYSYPTPVGLTFYNSSNNVDYDWSESQFSYYGSGCDGSQYCHRWDVTVCDIDNTVNADVAVKGTAKWTTSVSGWNGYFNPDNADWHDGDETKSCRFWMGDYVCAYTVEKSGIDLSYEFDTPVANPNRVLRWELDATHIIEIWIKEVVC